MSRSQVRLNMLRIIASPERQGQSGRFLKSSRARL